MAKAKVKQTEIPLKGKGVEKLCIKEIEDAAEKYTDARDERIQLSEAEADTKKELMEVMHKHRDKLIQEVGGGVSYRFGDKLVTLAPSKETVKVKSIHDEASDVQVEQD